VESSVRPFSFCAELIKAASLIAWDELPAANVAWLDCVDQLCQTIMQNDKPFGGIPFSGSETFARSLLSSRVVDVRRRDWHV
jgi:PIF1-like helicase